jgi:hypothetical protein
MRFALIIPVLAVVLAANSYAQARIWRCGNTYTNDKAEAQTKSCKVVEGGNVTVVEGTKPNGGVRVATAPPTASPTPAASPAGQRIDSGEQRARDADARAILEAELKKAEARHAELLKEYNNGEPEKLGPEHRNHQKYLDRVAELKTNIARNESDIAGLKRELGRASASATATK